MDEAYKNDGPVELDANPNGIDCARDSDDSDENPEEMDMEMYHLFVQLASGSGRVHKPAVRNDGVPLCGSRGTRFADLQIGHDWGFAYQLCNKCFGNPVGDEPCPFICDYTIADEEGVPKQCGRRCRGDLLRGHLRPSDENFSVRARHRCALHSELVPDDDI